MIHAGLSFMVALGFRGDHTACGIKTTQADATMSDAIDALRGLVPSRWPTCPDCLERFVGALEKRKAGT